MEVTFSSEKLRKQCTEEKKMTKAFGELCKPLQRRLTELEAADSLGLMPQHAKCHPLTGNRGGQFALKLSANKRLIIAPNNNPLPKTEDDGIDILKVTKVRVVEVVDYHGE